MSLYFECHVTIEPVFDERLEQFKSICSSHRFHVAELLLKKRATDTEKRSAKDSFCTGRSADGEELRVRMRKLIKELQSNEFEVWRYKIEDTVLDSKFNDIEGLLDVTSNSNITV